MSFGSLILQFYNELKVPLLDDKSVEVLLPFSTELVQKVNEDFYRKFYNDQRERIFIIGINPGRFGAGVTGIPFTDPVNLKEILGIENPFPEKHELSSRFVYAVINKIGGREIFFNHFYLTAVSPVGFVRNGKNLNYYDIKYLKEDWESFFIKSIKKQLEAGGNRNIGIVLGRGENSRYFEKINSRTGLFKNLIFLPHPRWIMQYRYNKQADYIKIYVDILKREIEPELQ